MSTRRIWTPAEVALAHPSLFSKGEIEAYEQEILANKTANEHDASRFFRTYPTFLYLGNAAEIRSEVVFKGSPSGEVKRVDFFRRRYGQRFWDIVELKHPNKPFIVKAGGPHARLSAEVDKAISQAQDYRDLLDEDGNARRALEAKGIRVWRPQIMVVVGKCDEDVEQELLRTLLDRIRQRGNIEAWSYNDIYKFAKEHYEANNVVCIPATHFTAIEIGLPDGAIDDWFKLIGDNPERLYDLEPRAFEELVARLFQEQGMDVELTSPTRDGGIDMKATSLGPIEAVQYGVQCKRFGPNSKVSVQYIRELLGAVYSNSLSKGIFVTTSRFTRAALDLLEERKFLLTGIDREQLLSMIRDFLKEKGHIDN